MKGKRRKERDKEKERRRALSKGRGKIVGEFFGIDVEDEGDLGRLLVDLDLGHDGAAKVGHGPVDRGQAQARQAGLHVLDEEGGVGVLPVDRGGLRGRGGGLGLGRGGGLRLGERAQGQESEEEKATEAQGLRHG